jgi:hypothetical protein
MGALPDRLFIDEIRQFAADLAAEERMIRQYNAGDLYGLYDLATKNGNQEARRSQAVRRVLLERNRQMAAAWRCAGPRRCSRDLSAPGGEPSGSPRSM